MYRSSSTSVFLSITHSHLIPEADVNVRVKSAVAAFGALLRRVFPNRDVKLKVKGKLDVALVASTTSAKASTGVGEAAF